MARYIMWGTLDQVTAAEALPPVPAQISRGKGLRHVRKHVG